MGECYQRTGHLRFTSRDLRACFGDCIKNYLDQPRCKDWVPGRRGPGRDPEVPLGKCEDLVEPARRLIERAGTLVHTEAAAAAEEEGQSEAAAAGEQEEEEEEQEKEDYEEGSETEPLAVLSGLNPLGTKLKQHAPPDCSVGLCSLSSTLLSSHTAISSGATSLRGAPTAHFAQYKKKLLNPVVNADRMLTKSAIPVFLSTCKAGGIIPDDYIREPWHLPSVFPATNFARSQIA